MMGNLGKVLGLFGRTLLRGQEPLISQIARRIKGTVDAGDHPLHAASDHRVVHFLHTASDHLDVAVYLRAHRRFVVLYQCAGPAAADTHVHR